MSASLVASFLIFISTGIFALNVQNIPNTIIRTIVFTTMLFAGCFYFYVEMYTETDKNLQQKLQTSSSIEWVIRCFNQVILLLLWFFLEKEITFFFMGFAVLYITYIFWDIVTWNLFDKHVLSYLDLFGFVITCTLFFVVRKYNLEISITEKSISNDMTIFLMGSLCVGYLLIAILGVSLIKFNPFKKEYWQRTSLH